MYHHTFICYSMKEVPSRTKSIHFHLKINTQHDVISFPHKPHLLNITHGNDHALSETPIKRRYLVLPCIIVYQRVGHISYRPAGLYPNIDCLF